MEKIRKLFGAAHDTHTATAAAGFGFEDDGIADLRCNALCFLRGGKDSVRARKDRDLGGLHRLAGFFLFAHESCDLGWRADELDVGSAAYFGEVRVFAEETVAGMNGVDVGDLGRGDDSRYIEIAVRRARRPNANGLVGKADVERIAIGFAIDGDGADSEFAARVQDAQSDF